MAVSWRSIQKQNFTDWHILADFLELDENQRSHILIKTRFPLNLPFRLAKKIQKKSLNDPLLRQFLPMIEELKKVPGFVKDPVSDLTFKKEKKLLQKYQGRSLLVTTKACAMNCRFCFRQNFDYEKEDKSFKKELAHLKNNSSISEIILSGGDPLSLSNSHLAKLFKELEEIPHLKRLRFHTRFPIGIPERLDAELLGLLAGLRFQTVFIIHCNHPAELDETVLAKLKEVQKLGIPVLSQTVLLKNVNDRVEVLKELFERMVDFGIQPYYLHQLDPVEGAAHFEVSEDIGRNLIRELAGMLPGYAVPRYVKEIPNELSKSPL
jgi:EF-P beta-lysylation protein EpmB